MNVRYNSSEDYDDAVYHFFQDAWHLKDWVKRDPAVSQAVSSRVESDLAVSADLAAAADVANGTKHFEFGSGHAPRVRAQIFEREIAVGGPEGVRHTHRISVDGQIYTATELADRVIGEWDRLLRGYGLL
jgi:hypothetical protein